MSDPNEYLKQLLFLKEKLNSMTDEELAEAAQYISEEESKSFEILEQYIIESETK